MSEISGKKIFVVEDEADISELVKVNLTMVGAQPNSFLSGEEFLERLKMEMPDLVLLDLMLPGIGGLEICKMMRSNPDFKKLPIIMLTAKSADEDVIKGLELGADDYVTKPFSPQVLIARIKSVLKRSAVVTKNSGVDGELKRHNISLHPGRHEVKVAGQLVDLKNVEFKILQFLMSRPGWVFTRSQLVDAVHGANYAVTDRSIDFQMVGLRKNLGEGGQYIETIRGVGYRFSDEESR